MSDNFITPEYEIETFIKDIRDKIKDDHFIARYGSTIELSMGQQYEDKLINEYRKLYNDFIKTTKLKNSNINKDMISKFLSLKNKKVDENSINSIFQLLELNTDSESIELKDFILSYLLIQEKLKLRKYRTEKAIEHCKEREEKIFKELENYKNEKFNKNGISTSSIFKVKITSALLNEEKLGLRLNSFVLVKLENNVKEFKTLLREGTNEPVWNEIFEFDLIESVDSYLIIKVCSKIRDYGEIRLSLRTFQNQILTENQYPLLDSNGVEVGKINLTCHLIWSNYAFNKGRFDKYETRIKDLENDYELLNKYSNSIDEPFSLLLLDDLEEFIESKMYELDNGNLLALGRISVLPSNSGRISSNPFTSRTVCEDKKICK